MSSEGASGGFKKYKNNFHGILSNYKDFIESWLWTKC